MDLRKIFWILSFLSYIFHAIAITEIGTALSQIKSEFMLSKTLGGVVASLQSLAGILAILGGILSDIFGKIRLISLSLAIMGVGLLLIYSSPFLLILGISFIIFGAGRGFFEASVNAFISEVFSEKRGMAINLLHIGWNIGSAIGPPLAAYMILTYGSWRLGYIMMSPPLMALSLIMLILVSRSSCKGKARVHALEKPGLKHLFGVLPLMMVPFLIVANQLGITTWLPSILLDQGASIIDSGLTVGLFWMLGGIGRLAWAPLIDKLGYRRMLIISGAGSAILMSLASLPITIPMKMALWSSSGFLLGPAYPTTIAWITAVHPGIRGTLSGIFFSFATLGSFTSAIAVGVLFELFGSQIAQLFLLPFPLFVAVIAFMMRELKSSSI